MSMSPNFGGRKNPPIEQSVLILSLILVAVAYVAHQNGKLSQETAIYFLVLIPAIILHEVSHGALAFVFGDQTAKRAGRLTLNPLRHAHLWGTFIIPGVLLLMGAPPFGFAKPVPVNTSHMSRNQAMFTGLIGPITNIVLALLTAVVINSISWDLSSSTVGLEALLYFGVANVYLATFNLLPVPPLDGAAVLERFLPQRHMATYYRFREYGFLVLFVVVMAGQGVLSPILGAPVGWWKDLLKWS